jgi:hypothetical protein
LLKIFKTSRQDPLSTVTAENMASMEDVEISVGIIAEKTKIKNTAARCGETAELEGRELVINTPPHLSRHSKRNS